MACGAGTNGAAFSGRKGSVYRDITTTYIACSAQMSAKRHLRTATCVTIACGMRMFFDRPDYDLASAVTGTFAIAPIGGMVDALGRDYANTTAMIFGAAPEFEKILSSIKQIEDAVNRSA